MALLERPEVEVEVKLFYFSGGGGRGEKKVTTSTSGGLEIQTMYTQNMFCLFLSMIPHV